MSFQRRIKRSRRGGYLLRLPSAERDLLRSLPGQLRDLMAVDDPAVARLFPPAYQDDPEREADYRNLMRDELKAHRLSAVEVMEATLDADRLDQDQILAWLGALNDLRLVLGTKIGVTEETNEEELSEDDPRVPLHALFHYLGWLEEQIVEELSSGLHAADAGTG